MLWKVQLPHSTKTHYILGTMHLANEAAYAHVGPALEKMQECSVYYGEIDLTSVNEDMAAAFDLPEGKSWEDYLSPKRILKYQNIVRRAFNVELKPYKNIQPLYFISALSSQITQNKSLPLDNFLTNQAMTYEMECKGIETLEEQIEIAKKMPLDEQFKSLAKLCRNPASFRKSVLKMTLFYQNNNQKLLNQSSRKSLGSLRKMMLFERNNIMTGRILDTITDNSQPCFFAMGAAHAIGNNGIIAQLNRGGLQTKCLI